MRSRNNTSFVGAMTFVAAALVALFGFPSDSQAQYVVVDTGQTACYGNLSGISCPSAGRRLSRSGRSTRRPSALIP